VWRIVTLPVGLTYWSVKGGAKAQLVRPLAVTPEVPGSILGKHPFSVSRLTRDVLVVTRFNLVAYCLQRIKERQLVQFLPTENETTNICNIHVLILSIRTHDIASMSNDVDRTLWVGNLSEKVTDEILYELFLQV
jgi:hypothetical protein